jgi:nonribosomal peptide synthetase protein BlmVI
VIKLTSGSTAAPKGALLMHSAVMARWRCCGVATASRRHSRTVLSWTPFFHDLGLFANLVHPAVAGSHTPHLPIDRFARDPRVAAPWSSGRG